MSFVQIINPQLDLSLSPLSNISPSVLSLSADVSPANSIVSTNPTDLSDRNSFSPSKRKRKSSGGEAVPEFVEGTSPNATPSEVRAPSSDRVDTTAPVQTTKAKGRPRMRKQSSTAIPIVKEEEVFDTDAVQEDDTEAKARRHRERNRVAAHKCRQKSKQQEEDLYQRERDLADQNHILSEHLGYLKDEVLVLKQEILKHGDCEASHSAIPTPAQALTSKLQCDLIQDYISRAAKSMSY